MGRFFRWKYCDSEKLILQKLDYMHMNPCTKKWKFCEYPYEYEHSSARFYLMEEQGLFDVTHYWHIQDIDLSGTAG